jgi:hypothetical protein
MGIKYRRMVGAEEIANVQNNPSHNECGSIMVLPNSRFKNKKKSKIADEQLSGKGPNRSHGQSPKPRAEVMGNFHALN